MPWRTHARGEESRWLNHRAAHRVLIAGGGLAGLEAMIALRELAGDRMSVTLLSPGDDFFFPSLSVQDAFAGSAPRHYRLRDICAEHGVTLVHDALELVEAQRRRVITRTGREVPYDALAIAVGAKRLSVVRGATTFRGPEDTEAIHGIVQDVEGGYTRHIAFIVPPGVTWPLPLYEVALMTAERARSACVDVKLTIVTPERAPLDIFGRPARVAVDRLLRDAGIALLTDTSVYEVRNGAVLKSNGHTLVRAARVVALPRLVGRAIPGLPADAHGFVPVDDHGRVRDTPGVWAAGDATTFAIKQGGIAAQQAGAVARSMAAQAGARVIPTPFQPTLRAKLLTGAGATYLERTITGSADDGGSTASDQPLWWPPAKVCTAYLGAYLDRLERSASIGHATAVDCAR